MNTFNLSRENPFLIFIFLNDKAMIIEFKTDLNKWTFINGRHVIILILPKMIYPFNEILVKFSVGFFFAIINKLILKFI